MQFSFSFDVDNSPGLGSLTATEQANILATADAAGKIWARYLPLIDVTLDVRIVVDADTADSNVIATGGPAGFYEAGDTFRGEKIYASGTSIELRTGIDPNDARADMMIGLTVRSIRTFLAFKTNEYGEVLSNRVDALSVFLHEIGHGLGIIYTRDEEEPDGFTLYDTLVYNNRFVGPTAQAVDDPIGVPLAPDSLAHILESGRYGTDLMSPEIERGTNFHISLIDLAILRDIGIAIRRPTSGDDVAYAVHGADLHLGAGDDVGYALAIGSNLYGEAGNDRLFGDRGDESLFGGIGNDYLDGGGGINKLLGEDGDDTYIVRSTGDTVIESPGGGTDTVFSSFSYRLADQNVENLTLTGIENLSALGNARDNVITGNGGFNFLAGGAGNDTYVLAGSAITDLSTAILLASDPGDPIGGGKNRVFVGSPNAVSIGWGDDTLDGIVDRVEIFYRDDSGAVWNLIFSTDKLGINLVPGTFSGAQRFPVVGPAPAQAPAVPGLWVSVGGSGANTLTGSFTVNAADFDYSSGGPVPVSLSIAFEQHAQGAVPALRGIVNWKYSNAIDSIIDFVHEDSGAGTDTIQVSSSYSLRSISNVENLTLTGVGAFAGAGNALGNFVRGNGFANTLRGDLGDDTLDGGDGYDTAIFSGSYSQYVVSSGGALVAGPDGSDTVANVERFKFDDAVIVFSLPAHSDVNGDNKADLFWQEKSGRLKISAMNGAVASATAAVSENPGPGWRVKDGGDFDGDGKSDLLWQNDNGLIAVWLMNGVVVRGGALVDSPGPSWHAIVSADFDGDGRSDILLQNNDGLLGVWMMNGTAFASGGIVAPNPGSAWRTRGAGDFDGDGKADILLQNSNGGIAIWLMNGASRTGTASLVNPGVDWKVVGAGDFNRDTKTDILLQNSDGRLAVWLMNGTTLASALDVALNPGPRWHARAADDVDGDGRADILMQHDSGEGAVWLMNGATRIGGATISPDGGNRWRLANGGLGDASPTPLSDFNGDGKSDLLLQNNDGTPGIWLMNGAARVSSRFLANPGADWHAVGIGDFSGDGQADILWQNESGQAAVWLMNDTSVLPSSRGLENPGRDWHVRAAGDFDGDGKSDILWQNDNGRAAIWLMDAVAQRPQSAALGDNPGSAWRAIGAGDFNGDGKSDILWQNADGQAAIWLMDGLVQLAGSAGLADNPGASWHVKAAGDFSGDGKSDILWQHDSGQAAIWMMDGARFVSGGLLNSNLGASWDARLAADLNGDGKADILWQNTSGQVAAWIMNGTATVSTGTVDANPGSAWHVIAA